MTPVIDIYNPYYLFSHLLNGPSYMLFASNPGTCWDSDSEPTDVPASLLGPPPPSLVIWSMANECQTADELGIGAMRRLLRRVKELDPTRRATYVANQNFEKNSALALADLVAVNLYFGMWDGSVADKLDQMEERVSTPTRDALTELTKLFPDKPIVLSEFGTIGIPGCGGDVRFSEDYQAAYVSAVWRAVESVPAVSGGIVWCWADYRHRRGFTNEFPTYFGPFGLVTFERRPKKALSALHAAWINDGAAGRRGGTMD